MSRIAYSSTVSQSADGCETDWTAYGDSCYWASTWLASDWSSARDYCQNEGGTLAFITSQGENDFVEQLL